MSKSAAEKWQTDLASWSIPQNILDQAEVPPWVHPPAMFALPSSIAESPSHRKAREALPLNGSVLDIGCGGGVAAYAVAPPAKKVIGVDHQKEMLEMFAKNAQERNLECEIHEGFWPDVAAEVPVADVVTVHHVVYNVGNISPFISALDSHARKRVVIELPEFHPMTSATAGWEHFWNLSRPQSPTADDFFKVVQEMGFPAQIEKFSAEFPLDQSADEVAERTRIRLCLPLERLSDVQEFLANQPVPSKRDLAVIWWDKV